MKHIEYHYLPVTNETIEIVAQIQQTDCPYFSLTGTIYEGDKTAMLNSGRKPSDRSVVTCGAIGDKISKLFPKFELLNSLHLSTLDGMPMYAFENGYYWISKNNVENIASHFRISEQQAQELNNNTRASDNPRIYVMEYIVSQKERYASEADQVILQFFTPTNDTNR
jgi:hypothetical protein